MLSCWLKRSAHSSATRGNILVVSHDIGDMSTVLLCFLDSYRGKAFVPCLLTFPRDKQRITVAMEPILPRCLRNVFAGKRSKLPCIVVVMKDSTCRGSMV